MSLPRSISFSALLDFAERDQLRAFDPREVQLVRLAHIDQRQRNVARRAGASVRGRRSPAVAQPRLLAG